MLEYTLYLDYIHPILWLVTFTSEITLFQIVAYMGTAVLYFVFVATKESS